MIEGYAPGGARRASATRSQELRGKTPKACSHLSGAGNEGMDEHHRDAEHAASAHPAALCTGTNADTCTPLVTGRDATAGRFSSSSSRRYGRNSLKGLRGGPGIVGGTYAGCGAGGGVGRRTDRSIGSATGSGTATGTGSGVGTWTGVGTTGGGGEGKRALSGDPAAYGGGDGAG